FDAILVGVNTVITDNPALTCRLPEGGRDPIRIVLDSQARTPLDSVVLTQESDAPTYVVVTDKAPLERIKLLSEGKAKVLRINSDKNGRIGLNELLTNLGQMEITSLLVEGGATVAAAFLEEQLVDKVLTFIAPKIAGGADAPSPVAGHGVETMDRAISLNRTKSGKIGGDFFIEGYPEYRESGVAGEE
ncbi:MAG TPA: RibD family protein, partial [Desulfobacteria bacterium]|nr:RibD family protein [Desulfobacteria bacterium]